MHSTLCTPRLTTADDARGAGGIIMALPIIAAAWVAVVISVLRIIVDGALTQPGFVAQTLDMCHSDWQCLSSLKRPNNAARIAKLSAGHLQSWAARAQREVGS